MAAKDMQDLKTEVMVEDENGADMTLEIIFDYFAGEPQRKDCPAVEEHIDNISAEHRGFEQYGNRPWDDQVEQACWDKVREEQKMARDIDEFQSEEYGEWIRDRQLDDAMELQF